MHAESLKKSNNLKKLATQPSSLLRPALLHPLCWPPARLTGATTLKLFCFVCWLFNMFWYSHPYLKIIWLSCCVLIHSS